MDRAAYLKLWDGSWDGDIWFAPWTKAVNDLTAAQAAWKPAKGRHSIWQTVKHVVFWRNLTLSLLAGKPRPPAHEIETGNFPEPATPTDAEWSRAREALEDSHTRLRAAIADDKNPMDRLQYHLAHDSYHLGQIMYLRAMQGLKPIE
jgi:uncharacterized damage-inducible protein DinB